MADDNLERQEVEILIKGLSRPVSRPSAVKPAAPQPQPPAQAAHPPAPAPGPTASSGLRGPLPAIAVPPRKRGFISAITLPSMPRMRPVPRWRWTRPSGLPRWSGLVQGVLEFVSAQRPEVVVRTSVTLGVLLSVAMIYWPYPKAGTWWLLLYMSAVSVVLVAGIWAARLTWITRLGVAHIVALGVVLWGITLAAEEALPRVGYPKTEAVWVCPE